MRQEKTRIKVAALPRYGQLAASTRYRFHQYIEPLHKRGIEVDLLPLLSDKYLRSKHAGTKVSRADLLAAYLGRIRLFLRSSSYDAHWLHIEAFPMVPHVLENALIRWSNTPYVLDIDDAFFHSYEALESTVPRWLLNGKIDRLMAGARVVFAGNAYIADRARSSGASKVAIIPTVVDTSRYIIRNHAPSDRLRVGWLGSPSTTKHLRLLQPVISMLTTEQIEFVAMGADSALIGDMPIKSVRWREDDEQSFLAGLDVGIMPLMEDSFARGKCGFKLIQYMACGLPVVASPVGANAVIVDHGENGFLPSTAEDWCNSLRRLRDDVTLRTSFGERSRLKACEHYDMHFWASEISALLIDVARDKRTKSDSSGLGSSK